MATAAAAAVARARRDVQHYFFSRDVVRPDSAVAFELDRRLQRRVFERMVRRGIIHEARPGHYWIDVVAYDDDQRNRFGRVRLLLLGIILALLIVLAIPLLHL